MSLFNTGALKSALREAGHRVSEGEELLAQDMEEFFAFAWLRFGLSKERASYALAYPHTVTDELPGHPGNDEATQTAIENETSTASTPATPANPAPGAYNVGATGHAGPSVASHPEEVGHVIEGGEPAPEAGKLSETSTGTLGGENSSVVTTQPQATMTPSTELSSNSSLPVSASQQQVLSQAKVDATNAPVDEDADAPEGVLVTQPGVGTLQQNQGDITHSQEGLPGQNEPAVQAHDYAAPTPDANQGLSDTATQPGEATPADTAALAEGDAVKPDEAQGEGATYAEPPAVDESVVGEGGTGVSGDQTPVTEAEQESAPDVSADAATPGQTAEQAAVAQQDAQAATAAPDDQAAAPESFAGDEAPAASGPVTDEVTSGAPAHSTESDGTTEEPATDSESPSHAAATEAQPLEGADAEANAQTSNNNPVTADTVVPTTDQPVTDVQGAQAAAVESQDEATAEQAKAAQAQADATAEQKKAADAQAQNGGATN